MSIREVVPSEVHDQLDRFEIIDVRQDHEFRGPLGSIKGARHVPLRSIAEQAEMLSNSGPLLFVCRSGSRSRHACETLQQRGVEDVTNLAGGMIAWNEARLPVVRTEAGSLGELMSSLVAWLSMVTASAPEDARDRVEALLLEAGVDPDAATHAGIDYALDALADELEQSGAPPDLELTIRALRSDLAVL